MALWQWIVGLFRKKSTNPRPGEDCYFDPSARQRLLDDKAADAARTADARLPPHQGGFNF